MAANELTSLTQALASYAEYLSPLPSQTVALDQAVGRVLAVPHYSAIDLPRFDQSAMDGYALRAADADQSLRIAAVVACGEPAPALQQGTACRIYTGAPIPQNADCVVPQENIRKDGNAIRCNPPPQPGAYIRRRGEELRLGDLVADAGQRITIGLAAALAMAGLVRVNVHRRPRIKVLITGDEVCPPGTPLGAAQIPDANGPLIRHTLAAWGFTGVQPEHVGDTEAAVAAGLKAGLASADLIITSGGTSVGDRDFLPKVSTALGLRRIFWKVAQKPGKPLLFATSGNVALLALPGNPAAVLIGLMLHVHTVLNRLQGLQQIAPAWQTGCLQQAYAADKRERLVRVQVATDAAGRVNLAALPKQASHMLSNLADANALARLPAQTQLQVGDRVAWLSLL